METWDDTEVKVAGSYESFEIPPDGAIPARICAMIDVGTHPAHNMNGEVFDRRTLIVGFELAETDSKGNPFYMSKHYTLSLSTGLRNSNLFNLVKILNGEPKTGERFNPGWLANKGCLLQISHQTKNKRGKDRTYANIDSIGRPPKGVQTPQGTCVVWRVNDRQNPMPDVKFLPPLWHESTGKVLTIAEWVANSKESSVKSHKPANPITQQEADQLDEIPF